MERARKARISRNQASQYSTEYGHKIRKGSSGRQEAFVPSIRYWFSTANTCEIKSKCNRQHTKYPFHHPYLSVIYLFLQTHLIFFKCSLYHKRKISFLHQIHLHFYPQCRWIGNWKTYWWVPIRKNSTMEERLKPVDSTQAFEMTKLCDFAQII